MGVAGRGLPAARRLLRAQPAAGRPALAARRGRDPDRAGDRRCGGQLLPRALAAVAARAGRGVARRHPARRGRAAARPCARCWRRSAGGSWQRCGPSSPARSASSSSSTASTTTSATPSFPTACWRRRIAFEPGDALILFHWDGFDGRMIGAPIHFWQAASTNSQMAGTRGLRPVLDLIGPDQQAILISHSRGGTVDAERAFRSALFARLRRAHPPPALCGVRASARSAAAAARRAEHPRGDDGRRPWAGSTSSSPIARRASEPRRPPALRRGPRLPAPRQHGLHLEPLRRGAEQICRPVADLQPDRFRPEPGPRPAAGAGAGGAGHRAAPRTGSCRMATSSRSTPPIRS